MSALSWTALRFTESREQREFCAFYHAEQGFQIVFKYFFQLLYPAAYISNFAFADFLNVVFSIISAFSDIESFQNLVGYW